MEIQEYKGIASESYETGIDCIEEGDEVVGHCFYSHARSSYVIVTRLQQECGGVGSGLVEVFIAVTNPERVEES